MRQVHLLRMLPAATLLAMTFPAYAAPPNAKISQRSVEQQKQQQAVQQRRERIQRTSVILPERLCTGFVAQNQFRVITAAHCIPEQATRVVVVTSDGKRRFATIEHFDESADLAALQLATPAPVEPLLISTKLPTPGNRVAFLGRTDRRAKLQLATVERLGPCPSLPDVPNAIFTSLQARPGDSGAPLVDDQDRVVGIIHGGARCHIAAPVADFARKLAALDAKASQTPDDVTSPTPPAAPQGAKPRQDDRILSRRQFGPFTWEKTTDGHRVHWSFKFSFGTE